MLHRKLTGAWQQLMTGVSRCVSGPVTKEKVFITFK